MAISFKDFQKRIRKNAKKGLYKKAPPQPRPTLLKSDTILLTKKANQTPDSSSSHPVDKTILKADSLITLNEILFETNSHTLKANHFATLDSIGKFLSDHPTLEVKVSGHTDNIGNERHNVELSARRAEAVAEYLIDKGAVYERIVFEGYGSSQPLAGNETPEGRSKNRRVEILIRNPEKK